MVPDELKRIIEKLKTQGKMNFNEAASEKQIDDFEKKNNVKLPEQYCEWLQYSDGGELFLPAGVQFYGVAHKPIIDVDENDRPDEKYIVIGALASGDPVLCEKSGTKISIYDHETESIDDELIYDDLYAFLNDLYDLLGIGE
ncbi:SMI1/KNR4 family protein [Bilifractor sp. LCP21S3_A7]|uniref:SMI1/KNR4 family protein n=1 Tax=Bilifractor sp. LCP21S3_A7 TaxID=3438738 RepID=UPI003F90C33B